MRWCWRGYSYVGYQCGGGSGGAALTLGDSCGCASGGLVGILIGVGICSTRAVARLEACGAALFPYLLVGSPSDLWLDHLLVFLVVVPHLGLWGDLPWALAHGPPSDLAVAPDLVLDLVPPPELRRREWQIYW